MSKDTIYREDAIEALNECTDIKGFKYTQMHDALMEIPSADRPMGEWIWSPVADDGTVSGCCNKCSFSHLFIGGHTAQYNYCPSCGARMKGADDD